MKLSDYLKKYGIKIRAFAKQLEIDESNLSVYLAGKKVMPTKYWKKVVELTYGEVTLEDMINETEQKPKKELKKLKENDKK